MKTILYKIACSECETIFYLEEVPGCVQCPKCATRWIPRNEDSVHSQGLAVKANIEEFRGVEDVRKYRREMTVAAASASGTTPAMPHRKNPSCFQG